ncbi:MAG: class I SAM-dependent methyltransferase, partial [Candidatus Poribacteria bacterium]|nr:class I SAM-dependent methyltransferase [Candidatus Poribacteria bacterium]
DVVSVGFGIRNVSDLEMGIREMARVAVPGGRVVILEFTQPVNPLFRSLYYFYFTKILPFVGNLISRNEDDAYGYLPRSVMKFPNCDALKAVMEQCGLTDVQFYRKTFGIVSIHVGKKPNI